MRGKKARLEICTLNGSTEVLEIVYTTHTAYAIGGDGRKNMNKLAENE